MVKIYIHCQIGSKGDAKRYIAEYDKPIFSNKSATKKSRSIIGTFAVDKKAVEITRSKNFRANHFVSYPPKRSEVAEGELNAGCECRFRVVGVANTRRVIWRGW